MLYMCHFTVCTSVCNILFVWKLSIYNLFHFFFNLEVFDAEIILSMKTHWIDMRKKNPNKEFYIFVANKFRIIYCQNFIVKIWVIIFQFKYKNCLFRLYWQKKNHLYINKKVEKSPIDRAVVCTNTVKRQALP